MGVALDGSDDEFAEFIDGNGVASITHITQVTHPEMINGFFAEYDVNAVPTFILSNDDGQTRDLSGWSESGIREDLDWLVST